jgi:hypothetical protein
VSLHSPEENFFQIEAYKLIKKDQRLEAKIKDGKIEYLVYFQSDSVELSPNLEPFITMTLIPAMRGGKNIQVEGHIDKQLLKNLNTIQDIFRFWRPNYYRIEIKSAVPTGKDSENVDKQVGSFFSGGLDGLYTLLKHKEEINNLIFIHGLEPGIDQPTVYRQVMENLQQVAHSLNKKLIIVHSNMRDFVDQYAHYRMAHGSLLAAVGHALSKEHSRIYIPATFTYAHLQPWGSHPLLDPYWSSSSLEFIHDGCEATRPEKAAWLAEYGTGLQTLKVCWTSKDQSYNCGRCPKCVFTMANLRAVGLLDLCTTFAIPLDLHRVGRLDPRHISTRISIEESLDYLSKHRSDPELEAVLRKALKGPGIIHRLVQKLRWKT